MKEEQLRKEIVDYSHRIYAKGWVANHDGNLSVALGGNRWLCTPTAVSKGDITPEMLIVVDEKNAVQQGTRKVFSEIALHRAIYNARPDINCVLHAHPPTATGFAVANVALGDAFMVEPVVSLGKEIPLVPFFAPNDSQLLSALAKALQHADVVMLANHGLVSVGGSFEQAFLRMELVEHLAKIALVAKQVGGIVPIPKNIVDGLVSKGRPASDTVPMQQKPTVDTATSVEKATGSVSTSRPDLEALVSASKRQFL